MMQFKQKVFINLSLQPEVAVLLYYTVSDLGIAKASGEGFVLFHALGLVGGALHFFLVP